MPVSVTLTCCFPIALRIFVALFKVPAPTTRIAFPGGGLLHHRHVSVPEASRWGQRSKATVRLACWVPCALPWAAGAYFLYYAAEWSEEASLGACSSTLVRRLTRAAAFFGEASHSVFPDCRLDRRLIIFSIFFLASTITNQLYAVEAPPHPCPMCRFSPGVGNSSPPAMAPGRVGEAGSSAIILLVD
jgi:hypothetical protein